MGDDPRFQKQRDEGVRRLLSAVPEYFRLLEEIGRPHHDPPDVQHAHDEWRAADLIPAIDVIRTIFVGSRVRSGHGDFEGVVTEVVLRQGGSVPVFIVDDRSGGEGVGLYLPEIIFVPPEDKQ